MLSGDNVQGSNVGWASLFGQNIKVANVFWKGAKKNFFSCIMFKDRDELWLS
ncbi:MAG: hypothetical protein ABIN94_15415 [Ferruginibacter sp.]